MSNYHENDIAELLENLSRAEKKEFIMCWALPKQQTFPYFDDPQKYIEEISPLKMPLRSFR